MLDQTVSNNQVFTTKLAIDAALLKRFIFLLGVARVVPEKGKCHLYQLLRSTESVGQKLTDEFYSLYAGIRREVFTWLCAANTTVTPSEILRCTQKLLDRVLFCAFCEDRGLLPTDTIRHAFEHHDPYNPRTIWENWRLSLQNKKRWAVAQGNSRKLS